MTPTRDDVAPLSGSGSSLDDCSSAFGISAALAAGPGGLGWGMGSTVYPGILAGNTLMHG
jgi:hypothetical protein